VFQSYTALEQNSAPLWWTNLDFLFITISVLAVYRSTLNSTNKIIKQMLWASWFATANYLLNEKREWINDIEEREKIDVVLKANPNLSSVNFSIKRVREDDSTTTTYGKPSFGVSEKDLRPNANKNKSAVVKTEQTNEQEPITAWNVDDMKGPTLIDRLKFWILSAKKPKAKKKQTKAPRKNRNNQRRVRKPHSKNTRKKQSSHSKSK
jgi:hypothetical protein